MYLEHLRVTTANGALHVERMGRGGSAVLLLHGFGTNASLWRKAGARLASRGLLVLAPDLLGHGESDRPIDPVYDLGAQADTLAKAMAALRVPRVVVVGQDVGALVGLAMAARHPARVMRLVLVNPPDLSDLPPAPVRAMQKAAARLSLRASGGRMGAAALIAPLLSDAVGDPVSDPVSDAGGDPARLPTATVARYLAPWVGEGGVEQLRLLARTLETDSVPIEALATIETETLVIRAERDLSVTGSVARALVNTLPNARLLTMPGYGRLLADEAPDALADALLAFMQPSTPTNTRA